MQPIIDLGIPARLFVARSTPSDPRPALLAAPARLTLPLGRPTDRQGPPRPRARTNARTPGGPLYRRTRQLPQGHARCFRAPLLLPPPKAMASAALMMALDPVADAAAEGGALRAAKGAALAAALPLPAGHTPKEVCAPRATCKGARALAREGGLREHGLGSRVVCGRGGGGEGDTRCLCRRGAAARGDPKKGRARSNFQVARSLRAPRAAAQGDKARLVAAEWCPRADYPPSARPLGGDRAGRASEGVTLAVLSDHPVTSRSPHQPPAKGRPAMRRDRRAKRARGW